MSRAVRRAQKQRLEEQLAAAAASPDARATSDDAESSDEEEVLAKPALNPFDLLHAGGEDDQDEVAEKSESEDEEPIKSTNHDAGDSAASTPSKARRKNKKKKKKASQAKAIDDGDEDATAAAGQQDDDDLDAILASHQAQMKLDDEARGVDISKPSEAEFNKQLQVDIKNLDPNVEMRKLFGSRVIEAERTERVQQQRRNLPRGVAQAMRAARKSVLVPVEDNWPSDIRGNITMEMLQKYDDGCRDFQFSHSQRYRQIEVAFIGTVQSGDPQMLMNLLGRAPFHINTLLQCSEILRHQGDGEGSLELLTRAIYAFDRALHPLFNLGSGLARLPFEIPENRPFYLAAYRYIQTLGRRACWTTAFEFNKLIFAMDPEFDPYATLLSIDYYAFKARRWDYISHGLDVLLQFADDEPKSRLRHWAYTQALALSVEQSGSKAAAKEAEPKARAALVKAVEAWPVLAPKLLQALDTPVPDHFASVEPAGPRSSLLVDLYVHRCKDIWATPEATALLRDAAREAQPAADAAQTLEAEHGDNFPLALWRHILLLDERSLMHHLPKHITSSPEMMLAWDPMPPENSTPYYVDEYFAATTTEGGIAQDRAFAGENVPNFLQRLIQQALAAAQPQPGVEGDDAAAAAAAGIDGDAELARALAQEADGDGDGDGEGGELTEEERALARQQLQQTLAADALPQQTRTGLAGYLDQLLGLLRNADADEEDAVAADGAGDASSEAGQDAEEENADENEDEEQHHRMPGAF